MVNFCQQILKPLGSYIEVFTVTSVNNIAMCAESYAAVLWIQNGLWTNSYFIINRQKKKSPFHVSSQGGPSLSDVSG